MNDLKLDGFSLFWESTVWYCAGVPRSQLYYMALSRWFGSLLFGIRRAFRDLQVTTSIWIPGILQLGIGTNRKASNEHFFYNFLITRLMGVHSLSGMGPSSMSPESYAKKVSHIASNKLIVDY